MELKENVQSLPAITVQGASRRWYSINTRATYIEDYIEIDGDYREVKEVHWNIDIHAAAWKSDIIERNPFAVSLCINPRSESRGLPIGDQVAALALALQNDKTTAMRIPLLAQFIVSPRNALKEVYQFSEEGVVMEDDVYMDEYDEHDIEEYDFVELYNKLVVIKDKFPEETIVNLTADAQIHFKHLINVMDVLRMRLEGNSFDSIEALQSAGVKYKDGAPELLWPDVVFAVAQ